MHSHTCDCSHTWSHSEDDILTEEQNQLAHTCEKCGDKMWWKSGKCPPKHLREQAERELEERYNSASSLLSMFLGLNVYGNR